MINKDFESFKKSHPTLLKAIMNAMEDACDQAYNKGRSDHETVMFDFISKWNGGTNSRFGKAIHDKFNQINYKHDRKR
jgi:hypothetical protein